jgi:hypothetical protein
LLIPNKVGNDRSRTGATPHYHATLAEIWTNPAEELAEKIPIAR